MIQLKMELVMMTHRTFFDDDEIIDVDPASEYEDIIDGDPE